MKTKIKYRFLSVILVLVLLFNTIVMNAFAVSDNVVSSIERTNSTVYGYPSRADIYVASSIAYMGAEWSSARQAWAFNFRFVGTGSADWRSGGNANVIRFAGMEIEIIENTQNADFWTSTSAKYLGSAPESGTHPNYGGVASAVVGLAITAINDLGASYAWSVAGLIAAFVSTTDSSTTNSNRLYRGWNWTSDQSDVGQFFWFIVDVQPNSKAKISTDYYLIAGYELLDAGKANYNLTAHAAGKSAITMNPEIMSEEEKIDCGIETISRANFAAKAAELNISARSQEEFLKSDEDVFYYAHNFVVEEDDSSNLELEINANNLTEEGLIESIEFQIDRSEKIVCGLSGEDIADKAENIEICEKHNKRINQLNDLLTQMESSDSQKGLDLNEIYMKYNNIIGN